MTRLGQRPWWVEVRVVANDCWLGVYWTWKPAGYGTAYGVVRHELHLYLCLLPCLPVHVIIGVPEKEEPVWPSVA